MTVVATSPETVTQPKGGQPLVSVIVACFNQRRYLRSCIESLLAQTYSNVEVIVVDDGSTDGSSEVARSFGKSVRLIEQPNSGPAAARNKGIRASKGEFIAFCDADDLLEPCCLERRIAILSEQPGAGLITGAVRYIGESGEPLDIAPEDFDGPVRVLFEQAVTRNWGATCGTVIRRAALERCGLMDPFLRTCEDWELQIRIASLFELWMDPEPMARARQVPGSLSRDPIQLYDDARRVLRKTRAYSADHRRFFWLGQKALFLQVVGFTFFRLRREEGVSREELMRLLRARPSMALYLGAWGARYLFNRIKKVLRLAS